MATFAAQGPPTSVTKSPAPSVAPGDCAGDSPYHSIVQDAQSGLMEKVQADVGHVVHALEAVWNEVGYSGEERRLQMDKLSDELTQTLRAKLAQEVEVRDVFKKDIEAKVAECEMLARSVDDDGTGGMPEGLDVSRLRLSHGLMKLEEEQAKLEAATASRRDEFQAVWGALTASAERLGEALAADCAEVGRADLTKARLTRFRKALEASTQLETERRSLLEKLERSTAALATELDDASDAPQIEGAELAAGRVEAAQARLQTLKDEKAARLARLAGLGEEISRLWQRLGVDESRQREFRDAVQHGGLRGVTFEFGEKELASLRTELASRCGDLTNKARAKIEELWNDLQTPEGLRKAFAPRWDDAHERTEAFLALHESEVARLEARKEQLQPLLKLVEKREELLLERTALHSLQKDSSRLLRKGPGAFAERKYEVDAMKRVKRLPKLTEHLYAKLVEWEEAEPPVLYQGARYLDKMANDKQEAAAERQAQLAAKKQAQTARKNKLAEMTNELSTGL